MVRQKRDPKTGRLPSQQAALEASLVDYPCEPDETHKITCRNATGYSDMRCPKCGMSQALRIRDWKVVA